MDVGWINVNETKLKDSTQRKENPVIPGDFADPSVIRVGNTYYATGTSSEWAPHFPLFQSTDLLHWQPIGYIFSKTPTWASSSFWAPELFYRNGTYLAYYVARKKSDGISCIGVATSTDPAKGFTDQGILLEYGKEAIDPFVVEEGGQLFITWKAYGLDQRPIEVVGARLSDNGLKVVGEPFMLLRDDAKVGLEGQCLVKRDGYYYLFFSPGNCCGRGCSYKVEVARATSLQGPYTRYSENPILSETEDWKCTGHGTLVTSSEGKDYYLYHAYSKGDDVYTGRQGMLGEVVWNTSTGWPNIKPLGEKVTIKEKLRDDFSETSLAGDWQWDFRHAQPEWKVERGALHFSGQPTTGNLTGTAMTIRPLTGNYEMTTEVINNNISLKGLVLYGDAGQSVGIGVTDTKIQVWEVKKDKRTVLKEEKRSENGQVQLKMKVEKGYQIRFYWSNDGKGWKEVETGPTYYNGDFLPPWDRSPRPGLMQNGTAPAAFGYFEIRYL
ncbi:family 43 glycosylhydrolase [Telluribacter humicola]